MAIIAICKEKRMTKLENYQRLYNKLQTSLDQYLKQFFNNYQNDMVVEIDINDISDRLLKDISTDDNYDENDLKILGDNNWLYTVAIVDRLKQEVIDPKSAIIHIWFKQAYIYSTIMDIANIQYEQVLTDLVNTNHAEKEKLPEPIKKDLNQIDTGSKFVFNQLMNYFKTVHLAKKYAIDPQTINRIFATNNQITEFLLNDVQDNSVQIYLDI